MITLQQKLTAIKGSIEKWEKVALGTEAGIWRSNCPLCVLYEHTSGLHGSCKGCPIYEKTGESDCGGTPFYDWHSNQTPENAIKFRDWLKDLYTEVSEAGKK